ncbi:hypothetical protein TUM17567_39650 [Citrobacter amalonaticus]|nr:hypothetical protein TUM17567_39650 [Citrobacter amalonaticus]
MLVGYQYQGLFLVVVYFLEKPSRKGLYIQEDYWVNFLVQEQRIRLAIIQEHSALVLG